MKKFGMFFLFPVLMLTGCGPESGTEGDPMQNKGIGPVDQVDLGEFDADKADEGKRIFQRNCASCHKPREDHLGPKMAGLLDKRTPEWLMNMIINPSEMTEKDPIAQALYEEYRMPMPDQNISEEDARKILEYMRSLE